MIFFWGGGLRKLTNYNPKALFHVRFTNKNAIIGEYLQKVFYYYSAYVGSQHLDLECSSKNCKSTIAMYPLVN